MAAAKNSKIGALKFHASAEVSPLSAAKHLFSCSSLLSSESSQDVQAGELVSFLLGTIATPTTFSPTARLEDDLKTIGKTARIILKSIEDGTLTAGEGEAVLAWLAEGFAIRRLDRILERISGAPKMGWFTTESRVRHGR